MVSKGDACDDWLFTDTEGLPGSDDAFVERVDNMEDFSFAEWHLARQRLLVIEMRPANSFH